MKKIYSVLSILLVLSSYTVAQDNCSNAIYLCASNKITATTSSATASASDPALSCGDGTVNNSVWFIVEGIMAGNATVTVTLINNTPGLEMQVYTGSCGSLVPLGPCASGNGPNGNMSINFPVAPGTLYYIMVDGTSGNQESFDIQATTPNGAILARPDPNFNTNPVNGCNPLNVLLENTTILNGGTNITWQWRIDGVAFPSSGADTNIVLSGMGIHTVELRVCNSECGCKAIIQEVTVQDLVPVISYTPAVTCVGTPVNFTGSASIQPDPPFINPVITSWFWDFGDPASGVNNTSTLQNPTHTFTGPGTSYTVKLVVDGTCGPDSTIITVNLLAPPVVNAGANQVICEGSPVNLTSSVSNALSPITYNWSGPGTISCDTCQGTSVSGLAPGGPYGFISSIVDGNGCIASDTMEVIVNPTPVVNAGNDTTVCRWSPITLNALIVAGTGPFTYSWTPATGLNDPSISNPSTIVTGAIAYCVTVTDSAGCVSPPDCINLDIFPPPSITSASTSICAGDPPPLTNTFDVTGAGAGSTYSWTLSADYPLITSANGDSSSVTATFPATPGSYSFTSVVSDAITGCIDTVSTSFSIDPPPVLNVNGPFTICEGESASLTASGATTYNWTADPAYSFSDPTLANQNVTPLVTTNFIVTGTTGSCVTMDTIMVTVKPLPLAVVTSLPPICGCDSVLLDGSGSSMGMIYNWTSLTGNIVDPGSLTTSAYACIGGNFTLTVTDSISGCESTAVTTLTQNPKPAATVQVNPVLICEGVNTVINLNGTGSNTDPGTSYNWTSSPLVPINNPASLITTATANTTTTFTLTVTDLNGCDSSISATVNVFPVPVINASPNSLCTSDPDQQITISINGADAGSTFDWTIPGCVTPNTASSSTHVFDFSSCGPGTNTFTVIVTQGVSGCVDTLSITIPIDSAVVLSVTPDQSICEGDNIVLTASGAANYIWSTGDSTASSSVTPSLSGSPHTYTVIGSTGGCSDTASVVITVVATPPPPVITGPASVCEGTTGSIYSITSDPSATYTWSVNGGIIASGQGTQQITVDWGTAGSGSVSVTETNSTNCPSQPFVLNVTVNPVPVTSPITGPTSICADSSGVYSVTGSPSGNFTWTIAGGVISAGQGTNSVNVTWASGGGGSLTVTETSIDGCSGTPQNLNISINANPVTSAISGPDSLCDSGTAILYNVTSTGGSTYQWNVNGGTLVSGQGSSGVTIDWPAPPGGSITVTETNSSGCEGVPVNINVYVAAQPSSSLTTTDTICRNEILQLNGTAINGTISWSTSGSGSFSNTGIATPSYTPGLTDSGTVSFTITVVNAPCPDAVSTADVFIHPAPPALQISGTDTVCEGDAGNIYSIPFSFGSNYTWVVSGGTLVTGQGTNSVTVDWGAAGIGLVIVNDTNAYGCVSEPDTSLIIINSIPSNSIISGDTLVCAGATGVMYSVPLTTGMNYNWGITNGTITGGQGTNTVTVTWPSSGSGSLTLTETNNAGCTAPSQTYMVNIEAPPVTPVPLGPLSICADTASVLYYVNANAGSSYNWTVGGGVLISGQNTDSILVNWPQGGSGTITVMEISANGCQGNSETINITVNVVPVTSSITGPTTICENTSGSIYSITNTGGSTYNWQVTGGNIISGQGGNTITVDWGSAGFGTVIVTETSGAGCTGSPQSTNIIINQIPVVSVASLSPLCAGETINLQASGGPGVINWTASVAGTFTGQNTLTPTFTTSATGSVNFVVSVSNNPCPVASDTVAVLINTNPNVVVSATTTSICSGTSTTLTGSGGNSYFWFPGGQTSASITVSPSITTTYVVTGTDLNNCQSSDTILINVTPAAIANAGPDISICSGINVPLSGSVNNATGGIWTSSGFGIFFPANNVLSAFYQPTPDDLTNGSVTLYLTTDGGCSVAVDSLLITFVDGSDLDAGPDQQIPSGNNAQLAGTANNPQNISWSTLGGGSFQPSANMINPVYVPSTTDYAAGSVLLVMSNSFGCTDTLRLDFTDFFIPNVITPLPHTSGYNDYFVIKGLPDNSHLVIFDRWGLNVFENRNYLNDWDAENLPDDTYFYILSLADGKKYNGIVRVIRNGK